jgi:hypothetical protein
MTRLTCRPVISATLSSSIFDILLAVSHVALLTRASGIGLETCILFAKEGANVLMADISAPALEIASAKLRQLVPSAHKVEIQVSSPAPVPLPKLKTHRSATSPKKPLSKLSLTFLTPGAA